MTTHCGDGHKSSSKGPNAVIILVRIAAMGLAVASVALMASASQCTVVLPNGPAHTVTYRDFSPFVYLVAANAIAAVMEGAAIFLSVWKKGKGNTWRIILSFLYVAAPALLYSATGAAFATAEYMSYCSAQGRRVSVCDVAGAGAAGGTTGSFCSQVMRAIYFSLAAAFAASAAEMAKNLALSLGHGGSGGSDSESDAGGCAHPCHTKH